MLLATPHEKASLFFLAEQQQYILFDLYRCCCCIIVISLLLRWCQCLVHCLKKTIVIDRYFKKTQQSVSIAAWELIRICKRQFVTFSGTSRYLICIRHCHYNYLFLIQVIELNYHAGIQEFDRCFGNRICYGCHHKSKNLVFVLGIKSVTAAAIINPRIRCLFRKSNRLRLSS